MSLNLSGFSTPLLSQVVSIQIDSRHSLMKLGNKIPWVKILQIIFSDLKQTEKQKWWVGRPMNVRVHLGAYLLQQQFNLTDRQTEQLLKDNAAYQVFCGLGLVDDFTIPDHTKIEAFRSRLSPETQRHIGNLLAQHASKLGYANPKDFDVDSTPQNANITYPSRPRSLISVAKLAKRLAHWLVKACNQPKERYKINLSFLNHLSLTYYRLKKQNKLESKTEWMKQMWRSTYQMVLPVFKDSYLLLQDETRGKLKSMASRLRYAVETLQWRANALLDKMHVELFPEAEQNIYPYMPNIHALHCQAITCINKNKPNKKKYYGRVFQLGRIGGNFLITQQCEALHMPDAGSLPGMVNEHERLFGKYALVSIATDTGYYSLNNLNFLQAKGVKEIGLKRPRRKLKAPPSDLDELTRYRLYCRRSGIEALIGQTKHGGQLERSRMKSDRTTLSAGYAAVLGFNLRQLNRYAVGLVCPKSTNDDHSFKKYSKIPIKLIEMAQT